MPAAVVNTGALVTLSPRVTRPERSLTDVGIVIAANPANPFPASLETGWFVYYVLMPYGIVGPLFKSEVKDVSTG